MDLPHWSPGALSPWSAVGTLVTLQSPAKCNVSFPGKFSCPPLGPLKCLPPPATHLLRGPKLYLPRQPCIPGPCLLTSEFHAGPTVSLQGHQASHRDLLFHGSFCSRQSKIDVSNQNRKGILTVSACVQVCLRHTAPLGMFRNPRT